jgi:hypothetical protein
MADTAPEMSRFELTLVRLQRLRSRHYRVQDPSILANTAGICESDRHRWPCHASILLGAIVEVLKLTRDDDHGRNLPPAATVTVGDIRAALARALLTDDDGPR